MWLSGFFPVVLFSFLPETSSSSILYRRTVRLRVLTKEDPRLNCQPELQDEGMSGKEIGMMVFIRPFTLSFTEPICFLLKPLPRAHLRLMLYSIYGLEVSLTFSSRYTTSLSEPRDSLSLAFWSGPFVIMVPIAYYNYKSVEPHSNAKGQVRPEVRF